MSVTGGFVLWLVADLVCEHSEPISVKQPELDRCVSASSSRLAFASKLGHMNRITPRLRTFALPVSTWRYFCRSTFFTIRTCPPPQKKLPRQPMPRMGAVIESIACVILGVATRSKQVTPAWAPQLSQLQGVPPLFSTSLEACICLGPATQPPPFLSTSFFQHVWPPKAEGSAEFSLCQTGSIVPCCCRCCCCL